MSENFDEEDYVEDEYVTEEDYDPIQDDFQIITDEQKVSFDEVFETIKTKITDLTNHDHMMEEKVLDSLRRGKLR